MAKINKDDDVSKILDEELKDPCDEDLDRELNKPKLDHPKKIFQDPILQHRKKQKKKPKSPKEPEVTAQPSVKVEPSMGTRVEIIGPHCPPQVDMEEIRQRPPYINTARGKIQKLLEQKRAEYAEEAKFRFCKRQLVEIPDPMPRKKLNIKLAVPSAEIENQSKVTPEKATPRPSWVIPGICPEPPDPKQLKLKKPKSGIIINATKGKKKNTDYDSFDLVYQHLPRPVRSDDLPRQSTKAPKRRKKRRKLSQYGEGEDDQKHKRRKKKKKRKLKEGAGDEVELGQFNFEDDLLNTIREDEELGEGGHEEGGMEDYLTKQFRRKVSQISKATSYQSKDVKSLTSIVQEVEAFSKFQQKFRRSSEIQRYQPPRRKVKRGTLESHSFTNVDYQVTLREFYFGSKEGTLHQGDEHFPEFSRNKQGICMSVAAYCYSILKHPSKWTSETVDEVLEIGNELYVRSASGLHLHNPTTELLPEDLQKYCYIGEKKIRFLVDEPEVTGFIRSDDKKVFNLSKALQIFFARQPAGIFKSYNANLAVWKDNHYYFFDAHPRTKDLFVSPTGTALMGNFYDIAALVTVLLDRSNYGNWPFVIYPIKAFRVLDKEEPEESAVDIAIDSKSNYNIINENKAVVLGSFDLADKCFDFTRNKQALAMAVICLVYSRITPPSAWHRNTVDKIMIIGNQLYMECMQCCDIKELTLDSLPAMFTVGPYMVEIYIVANRFADVMYKKCNCQFAISLAEFFERNTNAIVQIGTSTLAIWQQRNMFYCFDPYSRNNEGCHCRDGTACVSMHTNVESLVDLVTQNFDLKDYIFYMHALKVCCIHRDPVQSELFPKHVPINEYSLDCLKKYKMRKVRKPATAKPITVDYSALAMRKLLAGETPDPSLMEIGSTVESLATEQLPKIMQKNAGKCEGKCKHPLMGEDVVADLDSPSLSDTQIEPPLPHQPKEAEEIEFMDLDSFELTQEELELQDAAEGGGEGGGDARNKRVMGEEQEGEDGGDDWYYTMNQMAQVGSHSLGEPTAGVFLTRQINTDITYFPIKRDVLYPTFIRGRQEMKKRLHPVRLKEGDWDVYFPDEPTVTRSQELKRETNFEDLPDDSQIIRGTKNLIDLGLDIEFIAPFVCIMAGVVTKKYSVYTWNSDVVDYVLKCGLELYKASKLRYDQVARLEIPRVSLGQNDYKVLVEYVFDTYSRQNILELAIDKILFVRSDMGVLVTPTYACALIYRNYLYYMFDGFGNNEVGLSEGPSNKGVACLARFKDVHSLASRIMYNKKKRELEAGVVYTRFVLSSVRVKPTPKDVEDVTARTEKEMERYRSEGESAEPPVPEEEEPDEEEEDEGEGEGEGDKKAKPKKTKVGYQWKDKQWVIEGTKTLPGRTAMSAELKPDHFVCLSACLILLLVPVKKWDEKKVDQAISQGKHIYSHADDLDMSDKRSIKNMLIEKYFFDIIVKKIVIENWKNNKNIKAGIDTVIGKRHTNFIIQFPNASYAIHKSEDGMYHVFDPYGITNRRKSSKENPAGWLRFSDLNALKRHMKWLSHGESYTFYNFEVTAIHKAPKDVLISHKLQEYELEKKPKEEHFGKNFFEDARWLEMEGVPWTRMGQHAAAGHRRSSGQNMWHNWDVEYPRDVMSMVGHVGQNSTKFSDESRGKQTLANLVVAIGMMEIYDFTEWNSAVMDSIVVNGDHYFLECVKGIEAEDYELSMDDLKETCSIFPYSVKITHKPLVEGTMFLVRGNQYNLYKALRYFFKKLPKRTGIITVTKTCTKKHLAFGKLQPSEYFVFDADSVGPPMFGPNISLPYILRMTSLNRLLHALTMILRGGDFYIFEVKASGLESLG